MPAIPPTWRSPQDAQKLVPLTRTAALPLQSTHCSSVKLSPKLCAPLPNYARIPEVLLPLLSVVLLGRLLDNGANNG